MQNASGLREDRSLETSFLAFVAVDILNFALFLSALGVESIGNHDMFRASSALLDRNLGILNTSILLTSGWFVALAVQAARAERRRATAIFLTMAVFVGSGFGIVKAIEYGEKLGNGFTPQTNEFFAFYYVITGVHLLHWTAGLVFLIALTAMAWRGGDTATFGKWLPIGALFWHMVDVIWIIIFPCLYFL